MNYFFILCLIFCSSCFSVEIPGGSVLAYSVEGTTKVFRLEVSKVNKEIFNVEKNELSKTLLAYHQSTENTEHLSYESQIAKGFGFNNQIPGPAIVVTEGDDVQIILENKLDTPTSLQFMGMNLPFDQESVVKPGEKKVYSFKVTQPAGTYLYESGYQTQIQLGMGLSGLFIVEPKQKETIDYDFGFVLQEWDLSENGDVRPLSINCNWFTMNGYTAPNIPILKVSEGSVVRLRFANTSGVSDSPMVLHGFAFRITGTEGGPVDPISSGNYVAVVVVHPGTTRTVEFLASQPGLWKLSCSIPQKTVNNLNRYTNEQNLNAISVGGLFTYVEVLAKNSSPSTIQ